MKDLRTLPRFATTAASTGMKSKPFEYTVNLPKTDFPMRANAAINEIHVRDLTTRHLYEKQRLRAGCKDFILHDGPPYANGDLHIGHALNKILKDIINRYKLMQGFRVRYVPGWDCHGLPIELKAVARLHGVNADVLKIRKEANQVARDAIQVQKKQFQEWGIMADWEGAYQTMDRSYIYQQLMVFNDLVKKGLIERRLRPVYWSPSTSTALAEAELEYKENHKSRAIYVRFPFQESSVFLSELGISGETRPVSLLCWTTTPWTLPANVAISINESFKYSVVEQGDQLLIVATDRVESLEGKISDIRKVKDFPGSLMVGKRYDQLLRNGSGQIISADFVNNDSGTGLVHTAPAHGFDDYEICRKHNFKIVSLVNEYGRFDVGAGNDLSGKNIFTSGTAKVIELLKDRGNILLEEEYEHKYPYDWRTKRPVFIRATEQWFIDLRELKEKSKASLDDMLIIPANNRLKSYIDSRSEWCISRQRCWGVPIPAFYDNADGGKALLNSETVTHFAELVKQLGPDCWWTLSTEELLPKNYRGKSHQFNKCLDTMDVWLDSGCSWKTVPAVADLYLEGSDQHRGWFQSSLLTSIAVQSKAPYKTLITHGFVLDEKGRKMSKSLGNVIDPSYITKTGIDKKTAKKRLGLGSDALRLWVASIDYKKDAIIGDAIIKSVAENLRKIRNTCRFMLSNLNGFSSEIHNMELDILKPIDRYILAELRDFSIQAEQCYERYDIEKVYKALMAFTNTELSAFYFDLSKDTLYNDSIDSSNRLSTQTALYHCLRVYSQAFAPLVPHLAEEVHQQFKKISNSLVESVFEQRWISAEIQSWKDDNILQTFRTVRKIRNFVNSAVESARNKRVINSISEATIHLYVPPEIGTVLQSDISMLLSDIFMVSEVHLETKATQKKHFFENMDEFELDGVTAATVHIKVEKTGLHRCPRCWRHVSLVENSLCIRCHPIVKNWQK